VDAARRAARRAASGPGRPGADGAAEIVLARAAARPGPGPWTCNRCGRVADGAGNARELSRVARRYLIEIYLGGRRARQGARRGAGRRLGTASYVEGSKPPRDGQEHLLYDLALLTDLAQLYRQPRAAPARAGRGRARMKPSAEYYLAEALNALGQQRRGARIRASLPRPAAGAGAVPRARPGTQALIAPPPGRAPRRRAPGTAMAESSSDPEVRPTSSSAARRPGAVRQGARARRPGD